MTRGVATPEWAAVAVRAAILLPAAAEFTSMFGGGGGGLDPRKMQQMMEQMGIDMDEFDAERVTVDLADGDRLVFEGPEVTRMEARGQSTYMVVGEPDRQADSEEPALEDEDAETDDDAEVDDDVGGPEIPEDDVNLVATRTGAGAEEAREALEAEDGDLAAAIARLE
jgi:nascent polypeptide-associated complex subunit alpha